MTIRHMEILKAISETGSFTKAARLLYITQSAVSHAVQELETEAGTLLFDRPSKTIRLTEAGNLLLQEILPILDSCKAVESKIKQLDRRAPIRIVSSITIASYYLPDALHQFEASHPDIPVYVNVVSAANAIEVLQAGNADIALVEGLPPHSPYQSTPFSSYPLLTLCSPDYPHSRQPLSPSALTEERLLLREKGSAIRDVLDSALYLYGFTAHPLWTSVNSPALIEAAKAGLGITVLPDILVKDALNERSLISLETEGLSLINQLLLVTHKDKYLTEPLAELIRIMVPDETVTLKN